MKADAIQAAFTKVHPAQQTLTGIEMMAIIRKGQMKRLAGNENAPAERFYVLAT